MRNKINNSIQSQSGAALVTALVVLMLLTMIGITGLSNTTSELRRSSNAQERFRTHYILQSSADYLLFDVMQNSKHPDYANAVPNTVDSLTGEGVGAITNIPLGTIPGLTAGTGVISYKGRTSYANLPGIRSDATHISGGGNEKKNPPIFEIFVDVTTDAGKVAQARPGAVYFPPTGSD